MNTNFLLLENNEYANIQDSPYLLSESLELSDKNFIYDEKIITLNESLSNHKYMEGEYYIEGIFAQAEIVNGNRRLYPRDDMDRALNIYMESMVKRKKALGESDHPVDRLLVDHTKSCLLVEDLWWEGNNVMGRAIITKGDGAEGDKIASLMRVGWQCSVSSRGLGKLTKVGDLKKDGYVKVGDYRISTIIDVVQTPSAPSAHVKSIMGKPSNDIGGLLKEGVENNILQLKHKNSYKKLLKNINKALKG